MQAELSRLFLDHSVRKLSLMQRYVETCVNEAGESELWRSAVNRNSIANIVLHLCGNVRQWIGSTLAGLPDIRNRQSEFEPHQALSGDQLTALLRNTLAEAIAIIENMDAAQLTRTVTTHDGPLSALEVIYQVVGHFQQHTGQIIFAVKLATGRDLQLYPPR